MHPANHFNSNNFLTNKTTKMNDLFFEQHMNEREQERMKEEAENTILEIEAAKILAKSTSFACEIHINGLIIGLSDITTIIPVLDAEKAEIEKFLKGEQNKYE